MKIAIIGTGYVGLTTAALFSELGNVVIGLDIDRQKIEKLKRAQVPFFEPSLSEFVQRNLKAKRLSFTSSYKDAVEEAQIIFICVGTPSKENGEAETAHVINAVEEVAKHLKNNSVIVIKSTVPVGIHEELKKIIKNNTSENFHLAVCPEFLREGSAVEDSFNPDRIVIGSESTFAQEILLDLHKPIPGERILCDIKSAQLIKYASNSFLATKISFANAISIICEKTGANIKHVIKGLGLDSRIGKSFLKAGLGYGGSCLPKDVSAFINIASQAGYDFQLLKSVQEINKNQVDNFVKKIVKSLNIATKRPDLKGLKVAMLGLAFKPNTDDIREAPSLNVIKSLLTLGLGLKVYDPQAMDNVKSIFPEIEYASNAYEAAENCDVLVIVTEWPEFTEMNIGRIKKLLKNPLIIDGRNIFEKNQMEKMGFTYIGFGI